MEIERDKFYDFLQKVKTHIILSEEFLKAFPQAKMTTSLCSSFERFAYLFVNPISLSDSCDFVDLLMDDVYQFALQNYEDLRFDFLPQFVTYLKSHDHPGHYNYYWFKTHHKNSGRTEFLDLYYEHWVANGKSTLIK